MLREIETQQTINGITILDCTNEVIDDSGKLVETFYDLTIIGRDSEGKPRGMLFRTYRWDRHDKRKQQYIKKYRNDYEPGE